MKKLFLLIIIIAAVAIGVRYGTEGDNTATSKSSFAIRDGESVDYSYDMTWFRVGYEARKFEQDPNSLKQPGVTHVLTISKLDATQPDLEFVFRTPGKERFTWKGLTFEIEIIDLAEDTATARITKI